MRGGYALCFLGDGEKMHAVLLDGAAVKRADTQVDPEKSEVIYCGVRVLYRRYTYVLLNKPDGVVSAQPDAVF